LEALSLDQRRELPPDRLDLGEFRHAPTLASHCASYAITCSRTECVGGAVSASS
jgi:hypothetical protein